MNPNHTCRNLHLTNNVLSVNNVTIGYKNKKQNRAVAENVNLGIRNGEMVCLLGPNGCGKSTLMRSIAGLQQSFSGDIYINNADINTLSPTERASQLSLVLTDKLAVTGISVTNIVAVGRYPYTNSMGKLKDEDIAVINRSLEKCGLQGYENRLYAELSDGEKQRVMIARALAQDTPLMMLDEPTAHLDLPNRIEMMKTMRKLAKETQKAILISTHELDLALQWADTIWIMNNSGTIETGTPEDLVLNGTLSKVFGNDSFFFDMMAGNFKMRHEQNGAIELIGSGVQYEWTKRALSREGYDFSGKQKAFSKIQIVDNQWLFQCGDKIQYCQSIAELLMHLRHEAYYMKHQQEKQHLITKPILSEQYV